jgi:hypothetical protein
LVLALLEPHPPTLVVGDRFRPVDHVVAVHSSPLWGLIRGWWTPTTASRQRLASTGLFNARWVESETPVLLRRPWTYGDWPGT